MVGINPKLPAAIQRPMARLLERLCEIHPLRDIDNDIKPNEVAAFRKDAHAPVDIEALFGTHIRTRTLVALHVLGGEDNIGRMQRNVLEHFAGRVRVALHGFIEEGIPVREDKVVRFNPDLEWLPELRALLQALAARMPEVAGYARHMDRVREMGEAGTAHAFGTKFRLFGSRVNQALLAALALYGPSNIMKICAAAGAVTTRAIDPLVESGLVARIRSRKGRTHDIFSLNAGHPTYPELRTLLRTEIVLDDSLPFRRQRVPFDGSDRAALNPMQKYLPYTLFGVSHKRAVANTLGMLLHTPNEEAEAASLGRLVSGKNHPTSSPKAMRRLEKFGVVTSRKYKTMVLYRLDESWSAYKELRNLILAMGRAWNEYAEGASVEFRLFVPRRRKMEQGRAASA